MTKSNFIGFPNLDLGPWKIDKFLIDTGSFRVAWYGVIITIGIIVAVLYCLRRAKQEGFTHDDVYDYAIWVVPIGIIGARLYYVIMDWSTGSYTSFMDIIAIWQGGLAIYGGVIAGVLTILALSYFKQKNPLKFCDMVAPGVMIAQAIGRWGNFMNGEAYGSILRYEFLGKVFETSRFKSMEIKWIMTVAETAEEYPTYAHPTFLYESLWNLIGFLLINHRYKNKKFDGQIVLSYIIWYGFGRMFIEGFRTDSLYLGNVRISQLVALGCVIFGVIFYHLLRKRARPVLAAVQDSEAYESLFTAKAGTHGIQKKAEPSEMQTSEEQNPTVTDASATADTVDPEKDTTKNNETNTEE